MESFWLRLGWFRSSLFLERGTIRAVKPLDVGKEVGLENAWISGEEL